MLGPLRVPPFVYCQTVFRKVTECWRSDPSFMLETPPSAVRNVGAPSPPPHIRLRYQSPLGNVSWCQGIIIPLNGTPALNAHLCGCAILHDMAERTQQESCCSSSLTSCLTELTVCLLCVCPRNTPLSTGTWWRIIRLWVKNL